jgi:hypothetical protein
LSQFNSLYNKEERETLADYLRSLYGDRLPNPDEQAAWRLSEIEMFHRSPLFAISNYFRIPDKQGTLVGLRPWSGQAILDVCIEAQRRAGEPQRVVGFKSRQVGWSTWMLARTLHHAGSSPNRRGMFLVPDEDVAAVMATRMGAMLNNLPRFLQAMRRIQNMKHIVFDNPNAKDRIDNPGLNSELQITVPSPMRGIPPSHLTISEYSHMDEMAQLAVTSSILPAMPLSEHSLIVIDTTPNGYDDFYYPLVMDAVEANPKWVNRLESANRSYTAEEILSGAIGQPENIYGDGWLLAFERWDWHEEYSVHSKENPRGELRRPPAKIWKEFLSDIGNNPKFGGEEEKDLHERLGVHVEKLYWRRRKITSYKMPTDEMRLATFRQEFATSISSGFIELDKTPFDRECLDALMRMERDPIAVGLMDRNEDGQLGIRRSLGTQWQQVRVYAPPEVGEQYAMAVDTNNAYESADADKTACAVMRYRDNKLVALYVGSVPEHELRKQVYMLHKWYFNAYLAVEVKEMGYQLIRSLIDMGVKNYYSWKRVDSEFPEPTRYPGWQTDGRTRPLMDNTFIEHLCFRDPNTGKAMPQLIIQDKQALREIQGLRRGDSGSLKHQHGKDDIFDAIATCLCLFRDPFGGFHNKTEGPPKEQKEEFELLFRAAAGGSIHRNNPSFASI